MKKILIATLAIAFSINSYCQDLTFMGVPITGTKAEFSQQLLEKGFSYILDDADSSLAGTFYNEQCILKINMQNDAVMGVHLIFMPDDNWAFLYARYKSMKSKLAKDYGEPTKDEEIFDTRIEPRTDIQKYNAVNNGNCHYQCYWFTPDVGGVAVSIIHLISGENTVAVSYLKMEKTPVPTEHLKFKGISMGCPPKEFAYNLERQGYSYITKVDDTHVLKGAFAGYSNCQIYVTSAQYENIVDHVAVNFPDQDKWEYLYNTYSNLKEMLTKKYGEPLSCIEKFDSYSEPTSDRKKMSLLRDDKCKFETIYFVEGHPVKLLISHLYFNYEHRTYISLIYLDNATRSSTSKHAIDDL